MEKWKKINRNPKYSVSEMGKIRRTGSTKDKPLRDRKGYLVVDLYENGERKTSRVHRLVAEEFVPNPHNKPYVNHIDGNKHNNAASNLEWVTGEENSKHAWKTGLAKPSYGMRGKKNSNGGRKGKPFQIVETGEVFNTLKECEEAISGNNRHINDCLRGRQKTHRGYTFKYL